MRVLFVFSTNPLPYDTYKRGFTESFSPGKGEGISDLSFSWFRKKKYRDLSLGHMVHCETSKLYVLATIDVVSCLH